MNFALQQLAIKYPYVKFLKIFSTDAQSNYDDVALPTLLVYRSGQLDKCFVRVQDTIGTAFDVDNVEKLLVSYVIKCICSNCL
jgi:hypothetical protein